MKNPYYYAESNLGRHRVMVHQNGTDEMYLDFLSSSGLAMEIARRMNQSHWSVRPPGLVKKP